MSTVIIHPRLLKGSVTPPPSKSMAHRKIICAALASGTSTIHNVALSQDIQATLRCMVALGATWEQDGTTSRVTGLGDRPYEGELPRLDCGESGSTLRFNPHCPGGGRRRRVYRPRQIDAAPSNPLL